MIGRQAVPLARVVRPAIVMKYGGQLLLLQAVLLVVPVLVALLFGDWQFGWRLAVTDAVMALLGWACWKRRADTNVQTNEAIVVASSMFILGPLALTWPLMSVGIGALDALFEAISGVTTTGLTTLATVEDKPVSFLFTRAYLQWYGGLGIAVLGVAVLVPPGAAARRLIETAGDEDPVGSTRAHARRIFVVYTSLTAIGIALLWLAGGNLGTAVLHALASVSTGGFSPRDDSLAGLSIVAQSVTTLLCVLGATPLFLYYRAATRESPAPFKDVQWRGLIIACLITAAVLAACLRWLDGLPWPEVIHHGALLGLSAQTTAGFSTMDPSVLCPASKLVIITSMLVGGGIGSTAGGFKILRLLILLHLVHLLIVRSRLPRHAVLGPELGRRALGEQEIQVALVIIALFLIVVLLSWLAFLLKEQNPIDSLFEVASAVGTVGLSSGLSGPDLDATLKGVLCVDMLMGRLEIFALLVVVSPLTWIGRRGGHTE